MDRISVEQILRTEGPGLSSRVCVALEKKGLSPQAARQRVSRANGAVKRLQGLVFPRGARFLYHETSFNSESYWNALLRDIGEAGPAYAPAIAALAARGGIVPLAHFDIVSGAPILQRGQIASSTVLERLTTIRMLEQIEVPAIGPCVALAANGYLGHVSDVDFRARLLTEKILLLAVKDWARKLGIASYDKISLRDESAELPKVGTFGWDLAGPSYLNPMIRREANGKPRPGFLVCDAVVGATIDENAIAAFVRTVQLLSYLRRVPPALPVLIADKFTREAFRLGRSYGIIMATPGTLFGRDVATGLATLLHTLSKAAAMAAKHPEVISELFNKLGSIEGAAANLRGALFEMIVGYSVQKVEDGFMEIGRRVVDKSTGKRAEIDVLRIKENREVWAYECKAHQPSEVVDKPTIERWVTERIPVIHGALHAEDRFRENAFHYDFWTCGTFSPDALAFLEHSANKTRKYAIGWKDGSAVRKYVAGVKPKTILETLDQHFLNHPITRIDRKYDGPAAVREVTLDMELGEFLNEDEVDLDPDFEDLEEDVE